MDDEHIPLLERQDDDDDDDIRNTHPGETEGETSFPTPTIPEETPGSKSTPLSNELKRQKIQALHDFLGVGGEC